MSGKHDGTDYYSRRGDSDFYNRGKEKPYPLNVGTDGGRVEVDKETGTIKIYPAKILRRK